MSENNDLKDRLIDLMILVASSAIILAAMTAVHILGSWLR